MKKLLFLQALVFLMVNTLTAQSFTPGKVYDSVRCLADPSQTYALYIPMRGSQAVLPIVYFFDPHADGSLPVRKYKALADVYGFIFVGSNNSKNGNDWPASERIWQQLSGDTKKRLRIDPARIYTCGFSGGAKVAGYIAIESGQVKGVIAGGAGLPDGVRAGDFPFTFTAIAGEGDMNMTELLSFDQDLNATRTRHRLILFDGKHEWAPVTTMEPAFCGLQCDAMRQGLTGRDTALIRRYAAKSRESVQGYVQSVMLIRAERECRLSLNILDGLSPDAAWFSSEAARLDARQDYQSQLRVERGMLAQEERAKDGYMQHFQQPDMAYWSTAIRDLQAKAQVHNTQRPVNQRLLAYLSLAFYSFSNQLISSHQDEAAGYYVTLYKLADPANSEAWYFSAVLNARSRDAGAAESDLLRAVACGFRDKRRLEQQPEFRQVIPSENFAHIEKAMKGASR